MREPGADAGTDVISVLLRLVSLKLRSPSRLLDKLMTRGQLDHLLRTSYHLHELGDSVARGVDGDIVIDIARHSDGLIVVFAAEAA
jgi:hypothetical protein